MTTPKHRSNVRGSDRSSSSDAINNNNNNNGNVVSFQRTNTVALTLTRNELEELKNSGQYDYIEPDYDVYLYGQEDYQQHQRRQLQQLEPQQALEGEESIPQGILTVLQADTVEDIFNTSRIPLPPPIEDFQDECFRVCVVDTGLFVGHPDLPFDSELDRLFGRLTGAQFGLPPDQFWFNPTLSTSSHGTHVTGTIFARGNNDKGVIGVIPDTTGMCLSIARVFPEGDTGTSTSAINSGVEWCANEGSRVINLSLGGPNPSASSAALYEALWEEGVLVVAAAGNGGDTEKSYPASYKNVLSVAAINGTLSLASFSQRNNGVDLAAPGVDILSTVGGTTVTMFDSLAENATRIQGRLMQFSPVIDPEDETIVQDALELVDCQLGFQTCVGVEGKACLIERGTTLFAEKAISCQAGGGILALIFNNADGLFGGSLGDAQSGVEIPVLALSRDEGQELLDGSGVLTIDVNQFGYSTASGTSMATPHVAGVAAKIWAVRPACTNVQIQAALFDTALDLGDDGRDSEYGHGLVQGLDAYHYLLALEEPCGLVPLPSSAPSEAPSSMPSKAPSGAPSESPSETPSGAPSETPSQVPTISPMPTNVPSAVPTSASSAIHSTLAARLASTVSIGMISMTLAFVFC